MKKTYITLWIILCTVPLFSQSYDGKGDSKINVGYEAYGYGNGVMVAYDYGLGKLFSIGAGANAYFDNDENDYYLYARTHMHLGIAFDLPCSIDIYPGAELGYLSSEKMGVSGYIGFRYFLSKKVGIFAEVGNRGTFGLSFNV